MNKFFGILARPIKTIKEITNEKVTLRKPALIVFITAVFSSVGRILVIQKLSEGSNEIVKFIYIGDIISVVASIAGAFVFWAIIAGVFHLIALVLGGKGDYRKMLEILGWAYIPQIFGAAIWVIVLLNLLPILPINVDLNTINQLIESYETIEVTKIAQRIFMYWSLILLGIGVYYDHKLSKLKVALVVVTPVLIYIFLDIFLKHTIL